MIMKRWKLKMIISSKIWYKIKIILARKKKEEEKEITTNI